HDGRGTTRWNEAVKGRRSLLRNESPLGWRAGRRIVKIRGLPDKVPRKSIASGGTLTKPPPRSPDYVALPAAHQTPIGLSRVAGGSGCGIMSREVPMIQTVEAVVDADGRVRLLG